MSMMPASYNHLLHPSDHDPVRGDGDLRCLPGPRVPPPAALPLPVTVRVLAPGLRHHSPSLPQLPPVPRPRPQGRGQVSVSARQVLH